MGRPAYRPGSEDRRKVQVLKAAGWPERSLARLLGICRETLRKAFAEELENGRLRCRAEAIMALYHTGRSAGNVSATRDWLAVLDEADAADRSSARASDADCPDGSLAAGEAAPETAQRVALN